MAQVHSERVAKPGPRPRHPAFCRPHGVAGFHQREKGRVDVYCSPKAPLSSPPLALSWAVPSQKPPPCHSLQLLQVVTVAQTKRQVGQALGADTAGGQPGGGQRAAGQVGARGLRSPKCWWRRASRRMGSGAGGRWEGALLSTLASLSQQTA